MHRSCDDVCQDVSTSAERIADSFVCDLSAFSVGGLYTTYFPASAADVTTIVTTRMARGPYPGQAPVPATCNGSAIAISSTPSFHFLPGIGQTGVSPTEQDPPGSCYFSRGPVNMSKAAISYSQTGESYRYGSCRSSFFVARICPCAPHAPSSCYAPCSCSGNSYSCSSRYLTSIPADIFTNGAVSADSLQSIDLVRCRSEMKGAFQPLIVILFSAYFHANCTACVIPPSLHFTRIYICRGKTG